MNKGKIVVALGGNALGNTPQEQLQLVKKTATVIADLTEEGYTVILGHGNGPQVGMINNAMAYASEHDNTPAMPFAECVAMSQGYIGYHLQQAITNELRRRKIAKSCASVVTRMIVDENDPGFKDPSKPVGIFYDEEKAGELMKETGDIYKEDAGRGWRKVVASPMPLEICELDLLKELVDRDFIVITVGGGGIPVVKEENGDLCGVSAVIDKDNACARLAIDLNADRLIILTAVDRVCVNFNKPAQKELSEMTLAEAEEYIKEGQFAPGSMLPKIQACLKFVSESGKEALITSLEKAKEGLEGKTGTRIRR
ncbi:MAG: carbamate kinase [Erysipelotrichaceae bacterium]|nr:carbamate kinase [Erysipelotrichaceae bacterium]